MYEEFRFKHDEFDNVPPVVPRFLFYLQNNIKPLCEYSKELADGQSIPELRAETQGWISEKAQEIKDSEARTTQLCSDL